METSNEPELSGSREVDASATACRICGCGSGEAFSAREMMYGLREPFDYFECTDCGCVQIASYPSDISRHYPSDYYAYQSQDISPAPARSTSLKETAKSYLMRIPAVRRRVLRERLTQDWLYDKALLSLYVDHLADTEARILDVGCGGGALLRQLLLLGYRNARGVDPYIPADISHGGSPFIRKAQLRDLDGSYDCISFHHALEHMPDQGSVLNEVRRLLAPNGMALVRIPIVGGEAWRTYRENWVQLDPPRHYYLHSERSLHVLAEQCGLHVRSISYDSTGLQFWGSELYLRDVPLLDPRSPARGSHEIFPAAMLAEWEGRAARLNAARDGDQVVVVLALQP